MHFGCRSTVHSFIMCFAPHISYSAFVILVGDSSKHRKEMCQVSRNVALLWCGIQVVNIVRSWWFESAVAMNGVA